MRLSKIAFICFFILTLFSCTPEKNYIYLQDKNNKTSSKETKLFEYKVKPKDALFIKVIPVDQTSNLSLNTSNSNPTMYSNELSAYLNSYDVDDSGFVLLPMVGAIFIKDLTLIQCQDVIQKKVDVYLKNAYVIVKLMNFKVTVLGEVNKPGEYTVTNSHINILEALGLAGDLTMNGNRRELMLVRQNIPGKTAMIDLTDKNFIYSDYFNLLPDDVIYVKPVKSKFFGTNPFPFATVIASISTFILILNYIKLH